MKMLIRTFLVVLATVTVVSCSKNDSGGSGGGNAANNPGGPGCVPDQWGNMPLGCGTPSNSSVGLSGSMRLANSTRSNNNSIVRLMKDIDSHVEGGSFYPWQGNHGGWRTSHPQVFRCGTDDGGSQFFTNETCEVECKNYSSGAQMVIQVNQGFGSVQVRAGPYQAQGGCSSSSNNSYLVSTVYVRAYNTNGNQGFTLVSTRDYPLYGRVLQIDVPQGSLDRSQMNSQGVYTGTVTYQGVPLGTITLSHR